MLYNDRDVKIEDELRARAVEATRLEVFGDQARALDRWEKIGKEFKSKPEQRVWHLLAGKKMTRTRLQETVVRRTQEMVEEVLKKAEADFADALNQPTNKVLPRIARNLCRDIRDLYSSEVCAQDRGRPGESDARKIPTALGESPYSLHIQSNMSTHVNRPASQRAFTRARQLIPGGVNSPARAFGGVGGQPIFIARGEGALPLSTSTATATSTTSAPGGR